MNAAAAFGRSNALMIAQAISAEHERSFPVLPWIRVPSLASKLLGLAARTLPGHWQARYGYRPYLLETFVEAERFRGTCYRAANWLCVGETQGRGKLGDHRLGLVPVKTVWLYPLTPDCRHRLCQ